MGRQVVDLKKRSNVLLLRMRSIDRFVNSQFFKDHYKEEYHDEIVGYILKFDAAGLRYFLETKLRLQSYHNYDFENLTLGEIRQIASRLGIEHYSDYNKSSLVSMVQDELSKIKETALTMSCDQDKVESVPV